MVTAWLLWTSLSGQGAAPVAVQPPARPAAVAKEAAGGGGARARVVLLWTAPDHPYTTHMYEVDCRLMARLLEQNGVEAVVSPDAEWPKDERVFEGVSSIVYYSKPAGDIVLSDAHGAKFREMMKRGVGFAAVHWGTCAWDEKYEQEYRQVLGGVFHPPRSGPKMGTSKLVQTAPESPVCRGWKEYDLHDEFYMGMAFEESAVRVLRVTVEGVEETVAWTYERPGGGRSYGNTLAHFHENFRIEAFRRAIVNGILWTAGVEVPAGGARVEVTDADLTLAPEVKPGPR